MRINNSINGPIPHSGITRISLWRHGMDRPQMISSHPDGYKTLNDCFRDMETERALFNVNVSENRMQLGVTESDLRDIAHRSIQFPPTGKTVFSGQTEKGMFGLYMMLAPSDPVHYAEFVNNPASSMLENSVRIARCFLENGLSRSFSLESGTVLDLVRIGYKAGMSFCSDDVDTLVKLASIPLPLDPAAHNMLPFPAPPSFDYSENHPDKKCSFGFNIVHPEKFPYNAQMAASAIRTFLESNGWNPQSLDMVLEPLKLPLKDGERVIHILNRIVSKDRTEIDFCIRKPLEYEGNAPIRGQIVFRK